MGCIGNGFILWSVFMTANMALLINGNHIDVYYSLMLGHNYFVILDNLVEKAWIRVTV